MPGPTGVTVDGDGPALLLNRAGSHWAPHMADIARMIPNATHLEFPGSDHTPWGLADDTEIAGAIEEFLTGEPAHSHTAERVWP